MWGYKKASVKLNTSVFQPDVWEKTRGFSFESSSVPFQRVSSHCSFRFPFLPDRRGTEVEPDVLFCCRSSSTLKDVLCALRCFSPLQLQRLIVWVTATFLLARTFESGHFTLNLARHYLLTFFFYQRLLYENPRSYWNQPSIRTLHRKP